MSSKAMNVKAVQVKAVQVKAMQVKDIAGQSHAAAGWLEERARVVAIFTGGAWVETEPKSGCDGCAAQQGCASGLLAR